jgi:hypothetical protein
MATANTLERRIETGEEHTARQTVVFYKGKNMRLITISRLVLELSARFALAGAQRIASAPAAQEEAYLLLDWDEVEKVFTALAGSAIMDRRSAMTVRGMWLPVRGDGRHREKGCAFLAISFGRRRSGLTFGFPRNIGADDSSHVLSDLCRAIERHRGAVRVVDRQGKMTLNIYLPVLEKA